MRTARTSVSVFLSLFALVAAVVITAVTTLVTAPSANAAPPARYVALGDSYSAGVGSGSYDPASGACERSSKAYPALWAGSHAPASFGFVACSGARTSDVLGSQLAAVTPATTLVSISVGGNDAGFSSVMQTCVLDSTGSCLSAVAGARTFVDRQLPALLDRVYAAIHTKAPRAHVVVLGYPHLYKLDGSCWFGIGDTKRAALNGVADELDTVVAKRAANAGFTFADVRAAFTGHEICSNSPWLHSTTWPIDESYHPTATGQSHGYLPVFGAYA